MALAGIVSGFALASSAQAQEAIPTATGPSSGWAPAPDPNDNSTLRLSDHIDRGPDAVRPAGPCGGPAKTEDGKTDNSPHGEVWAGVGNHGYRDAGGTVCMPLGSGAAVSIAVDAGQSNGWGRH
jgi:hypothetical protein